MTEVAHLFPPSPTTPPPKRSGVAEDGWNTATRAGRLAYTPDSRWRNRAILRGRPERSSSSSTRKWAREQEYRLIKELWAFTAIALRSASPTSGTTTRVTGSARTATRTGSSTLGGLMAARHASINDCGSRRPTGCFAGPRAAPDDHPGLSELGL